ncbi:MAG: hypothetical protein QHH15_07770 [Candidatus Thermoplasmatota archaeon]|jgi:hypothetical protein|nr:hypothetical protein [Candidatus Thermoplasmatota archaeon]
MDNYKNIIKTGSILLLTIILILTSFNINAEETKNNNYSNDNPDQIGLRHIKILRGWASGNATSGKLIGLRGKIAKINFEYLRIAKYALIPPRWEYSDFWDVTAIFLKVDQTIPQGHFEFEPDWVLAIIFE